MAERPRYVVHDLIFATRLARPTGVERVAINTFIASAHNNANAIALVADRSRVPAGLPVIAVGHYLPVEHSLLALAPGSPENRRDDLWQCACVTVDANEQHAAGTHHRR
jgi:hypothetical protein